MKYIIRSLRLPPILIHKPYALPVSMLVDLCDFEKKRESPLCLFSAKLGDIEM